MFVLPLQSEHNQAGMLSGWIGADIGEADIECQNSTAFPLTD
jgi:hypothetical protein